MHRYSKQLKIDIASLGGKKPPNSWTAWGVSTKRYPGGYWASLHKCIAQSVKFISTYTDKPAMNITALVTVLNSVSANNETVHLSFIVHINSHWSGIICFKIPI